MDEQILHILAELGSEGIGLGYLYVILHYFMKLIVFGAAVWGIRTVWPIIKKALTE